MDARALDIAVKATGLRPDQVRRAVEEYRSAVSRIEAEPEWQALSHMSGGGFGLHQYLAEGTSVTLQIESWKERGVWQQKKCYVWNGRPYEYFSEARSAELAATAKPKPYDVAATP